MTKPFRVEQQVEQARIERQLTGIWAFFRDLVQYGSEADLTQGIGEDPNVSEAVLGEWLDIQGSAFNNLCGIINKRRALSRF